MPPVHLEFIIEELPAGFDALLAEAQTEGFRHVERFVADWTSRLARFDRDGEALLAGHVSGVLAGIGGLTIEPVVPGALRMRRFYVRPPFRRTGIGRKLANALLEQASRAGRPVTVNAAPGSTAFREALGFGPDRRDRHTHRFDPE